MSVFIWIFSAGWSKEVVVALKLIVIPHHKVPPLKLIVIPQHNVPPLKRIVIPLHKVPPLKRIVIPHHNVPPLKRIIIPQHKVPPLKRTLNLSTKSRADLGWSLDVNAVYTSQGPTATYLQHVDVQRGHIPQGQGRVGVQPEDQPGGNVRRYGKKSKNVT